ncbi:hypothetical protein HDU97_004307 [Phlyctochytrium planicorne]|nr:hypothetical protein HDU97_004307 [Phlyctochytrium planicorne]
MAVCDGVAWVNAWGWRRRRSGTTLPLSTSQQQLTTSSTSSCILSTTRTATSTSATSSSSSSSSQSSFLARITTASILLLAASLSIPSAFAQSTSFISQTPTSTPIQDPSIPPPPGGACNNLRIILEAWGFTIEFGPLNPAFCGCNFKTTNGKVKPFTVCGMTPPIGFEALYISSPPKPLDAYPELLLPGLGVTEGFENLFTLSTTNNSIYGDLVLLDTAKFPALLATLDIANNPRVTGTWPSPEFFSVTTIIVKGSNLCCPDQIPAKNIACIGATQSCIGGIVIPEKETNPIQTVTATLDPLRTTNSVPTYSPESSGSEQPNGTQTISTTVLAIIISTAIVVVVLIVISVLLLFCLKRRALAGARVDESGAKDGENAVVVPAKVEVKGSPTSSNGGSTPRQGSAQSSSMFPDLAEETSSAVFLVSNSGTGTGNEFLESQGMEPTPAVEVTAQPAAPAVSVALPAGKEGTWQASPNIAGGVAGPNHGPGNPSYMQIPSWSPYGSRQRQPPPANAQHLFQLKRSVMDPPRQFAKVPVMYPKLHNMPSGKEKDAVDVVVKEVSVKRPLGLPPVHGPSDMPNTPPRLRPQRNTGHAGPRPMSMDCGLDVLGVPKVVEAGKARPRSADVETLLSKENAMDFVVVPHHSLEVIKEELEEREGVAVA